MTAGSGPTAQPLATCGSEQLHLTGRIQAHGALIAADLHNHRITYASANTAGLIGVPPSGLFDSPLMSVFSPDEQQRLEQAIEKSGQRLTALDVYGVGLATPFTFNGEVDVILHQAGGQTVLEIERAHDDNQVSLAEVLQTSQEIGEAASVAEVEEAIVSAVRTLTGFDRAMVYRFHEDEHGEVVAEDCRPGLVRYLGHHFPANDIPLQARQIYTRTASRYIPDVNGGDVAVMGSPRMAGAALDLSQVRLRSVSPFHLEYMRNMKTAASVSFAIAEGDRLTRLVSCTSEEPRFLSHARRRSCELLVLQTKLQVAAAERISRLRNEVSREATRVRLRTAMQNAPTVAEGLTSASATDLLDICQADAAVVCADGQYRSMGPAPSEHAVRRLHGEIRAEVSPGVPWATNRLQQSIAAALGAAGCLFVELATPDDFLAWFRRDRPQQIRWLGDPHAHSTGVINPRKSFDTWLERASGSSAPWTGGDLEAAALVATDVETAQLSRAQAKLAYLGLYDALTGLPNRRHLSNAMASMLAKATQTEPVAAIFIDLNHFKAVNDDYGHDAGDCVLREAARRIAEVTRAGADVVGRADVWDPPAGRLGGDEFVVVLPRTDAEGAALVANRIRQAFRTPIALGPDQNLTIGAAIGVTLAVTPEDPDDVLRRADAAMYADKRERRISG